MTTTVAIDLPWGLFHATPWDRSVNEGAVEWPPSPWRLLRALFATWKTRCSDLPASDVVPVLESLATPPRFLLPPFTIGHTRHYLPGMGHLEGIKNATVKTFDPFVATARDGRILIEWDIELDSNARTVLRQLMSELSYLGRAESIVDASLLDSSCSTDAQWLAEIQPDSVVGDVTRLLAPTLPLDFDALTMSPNRVRTDRRLVPPATRWLTYPKPQTAVAHWVRPEPKIDTVTAVRFALTGSPQPPRTAAVAFGDVLRRACMSHYGRRNDGAASSALAGKDSDGKALRGLHGHAHYLAFGAHGGRGKQLDTMVVWANDGLSEAEVSDVARTIQLRARLEAVDDKVLGVEGYGPVENIAPELCGPARTWATYTPYAPTKHWKGSPEHQLRSDVEAELAARGIDALLDTIVIIRGNWLDYRRYRVTEKLRDARRAFGLQLTFDRDISGPLCLGALSHFGLGLFLPT